MICYASGPRTFHLALSGIYPNTVSKASYLRLDYHRHLNELSRMFVSALAFRCHSEFVVLISRCSTASARLPFTAAGCSQTSVMQTATTLATPQHLYPNWKNIILRIGLQLKVSALSTKTRKKLTASRWSIIRATNQLVHSDPFLKYTKRFQVQTGLMKTPQKRIRNATYTESLCNHSYLRCSV